VIRSVQIPFSYLLLFSFHVPRPKVLAVEFLHTGNLTVSPGKLQQRVQFALQY
jgi:hypothetical protein